MSAGFAPNFPVSTRRSRVYFCCDITIPAFDLATSIPGKYFSKPRSLISNSFKRSFSVDISSNGDHYFINIHDKYDHLRIPSFHKYNVIHTTPSEPHPYLSTTLLNLSNHARGDCLSPYNDFLRKQTLRSCPLTTNPGERSM